VVDPAGSWSSRSIAEVSVPRQFGLGIGITAYMPASCGTHSMPDHLAAIDNNDPGG
jgi:hypothetical protein